MVLSIIQFDMQMERIFVKSITQRNTVLPDLGCQLYRKINSIPQILMTYHLGTQMKIRFVFRKTVKIIVTITITIMYVMLAALPMSCICIPYKVNSCRIIKPANPS